MKSYLFDSFDYDYIIEGIIACIIMTIGIGFIFYMIYSLCHAFYRCVTKFEKRITVRKKHLFINHSDYSMTEYHYITDTFNNMYQIKHYRLCCNSEKVWKLLEKRKTYDVKGYGIYSKYPNIVTAEFVE